MDRMKMEAEELLQSLGYRDLMGVYGTLGDISYLSIVEKIAATLVKVRHQGVQDGYAECYNDFMDGLKKDKEKFL